jgi:DNA-binding transcriptional MerR regulator
MILRDYLRTSDLALAGHLSVQQVRNYEASGFIPPAARSPAGYRLYTRQHLVALQTVRRLVGGYSWGQARAIMQAVHQGQLAVALAQIDERHAELADQRLQLEQTLAALRLLAVPAALPVGPRLARPLRVGEAARHVGVRVSALRFWEQQGLVQPVRDPGSLYRLYDEPQMRRLRVVVLLRKAGYDFPAIHLVLAELAAGQTAKAIAAVEKRRSDLARTSATCLTALAAFHSYVHEFWADQWAAL